MRNTAVFILMSTSLANALGRVFSFGILVEEWELDTHRLGNRGFR